MRGHWATRAPDGLVEAAKPAHPGRGVPRRRGAASGQLANAVLAHLPLAVAVVDADLRLSYWNEQAACLFEVPPLMAADAPALADILAGVAGLTQQQRDRIVAFGATHIAAGDRVEPESWLRISLGRRRITIQVHGIGSHHWMLLIDDGKMAAAAGRGGTSQGSGDAWLDPLTGLGNRRHFNQVLRNLTDNAPPGAGHPASRQTASTLTVLLIDLDRFKPINDTLGHPVGDALLCLVAQRLRRECREDDLLVRLGGDEFVILLANDERAEALASRVVDILSRPFLVEGQMASIGASVGIARYPEHGVSTDDLMRHAGLALRDAKSAGGQTCRVFEPAVAAEALKAAGIDTSPNNFPTTG